MGTRSLTAFTHEGKTHYQYIQFDGYLSGRGVEFLEVVGSLAERMHLSIHYPLSEAARIKKARQVMVAHLGLMELASPHSWGNNGSMPTAEFLTNGTWSQFDSEFVRVLDLDNDEAVFYGGNPNEVLFRIKTRPLALLWQGTGRYNLEQVFKAAEIVAREKGAFPKLEVHYESSGRGRTLKESVIVTMDGYPVVVEGDAPETVCDEASEWREAVADQEKTKRVAAAKALIAEVATAA